MIFMVMEGTSKCSIPIEAKEEDPSWPNIVFPSKLSSSDHFSGSTAYYGWEWQFAFPMQEGILDATVPFEEESFTSCSMYPPLDIVDYNPNDDIYLDHGGSHGVWSELRPLMDSTTTITIPIHLGDDVMDLGGDEPVIREEFTTIRSNKGISKRPIREEEEIIISNMSGSASKALTRETISKYFYMPITEAARQLNVGLTLLKKRCRELGIHRWPHRKLMSLQTLIKNVQELARAGGEGSEEKLREAIDVLERERKQLEERPDTQIGTKTKRLRQACFKANYKKRKLHINNNIATTTTTSSEATTTATTSVFREDHDNDHDREDEEIRSLLCNF